MNCSEAFSKNFFKACTEYKLRTAISLGSPPIPYLRHWSTHFSLWSPCHERKPRSNKYPATETRVLWVPGRSLALRENWSFKDFALCQIRCFSAVVSGWKVVLPRERQSPLFELTNAVVQWLCRSECFKGIFREFTILRKHYELIFFSAPSKLELRFQRDRFELSSRKDRSSWASKFCESVWHFYVILLLEQRCSFNNGNLKLHEIHISAKI